MFNQSRLSRLLILSALTYLLPTLGAAAPLPSAAKFASSDKPDRHVTGYLVTLREPSVIAFEDPRQLSGIGKALLFRPTAPSRNEGRFDPESVTVRAYRGYLRRRQDDLVQEISAAAGKSILPVFRWDVVGNGFSVRATVDDAARIARHPDVLSVTPDYPVEMPSYATPATVGAEPIWLGAVTGVLQTRGEGVVIGNIDSGINSAHPAFAELASDGFRHVNPRVRRYGLCLDGPAAARCNDKLIGLYDYQNEPGAQGENAGADLSGHGSAVASLMAGNPVTSTVNGPTASVPLLFSGVAPRANLISYKVHYATPGHNSAPGAVMAAINQATIDRVDIMTLEYLANTDLDPWQHPRAMAILQAREAGVIPIAAGGNEGIGHGIRAEPSFSPWVMTVAASRHSKAFVTQLINLRGPGIPFPMTLSGQSISSAAPDAELVYASDVTAGNSQCGQGTAQAVPTGASNPFPAGSLTGRIVVCDEASYFAAEMGFNAKLAGAVGIVLLNGDFSERRQHTPVTQHHLPAVHLNFSDSNRLRSALVTARTAGVPLRAGITATTVGESAVTGLLADYSSRGPVVHYDGVLKPDVASPGPQTFGAQDDGSGYRELRGTSAALPGVAGAVALLKAGKPGWGVSQIFSALQTTANHGFINSTDAILRPAAPLEDGSGLIRVDQAARAGLYFAVSPAEFRNANPATGGDPSQLNLPSIYSRGCLSRCSYRRRVTALVGGTWSAELVADPSLGLNVTPAQFSLAAGDSVDLNITVEVGSGIRAGTVLNGSLQFVSVTAPAQVAVTRVPIAIQAGLGHIPTVLELGSQPAKGNTTVLLHNTAEIRALQFRSTPLRAPRSIDFAALRNSYRVFPVARPMKLEGRSGVPGKFRVEIDSSVAPDLDLYVGFDRNGDGDPLDSNELACVSTSLSSAESCEFDISWSPETQLMFAVYGYSTSSQASDMAVARTYNELFDSRPDGLVVTSGLGKKEHGSDLPLNLAWRMDSLPVGALGRSWVTLTSPTFGDLGTAEVRLSRAAGEPPAVILDARADSLTVSLEPGQAHERIVIDVPANQTALVLRTEGTGGNVDLYVSRSAAAPTPPNFAAAPPRSQQPFRSVSEGNTERVAISAGQLTAGRYYVTPVNAGTTVANVVLNVLGEFTGSIVQPAANGYFNPARSGHGVFLARTPQVWALAWYTFDTAGRPVWYTAQGTAAGANDGVWSAPIYRSTWSGSRDTPQEVGRAILTFDGNGSFTYSWLLDGEYGSEPFVAIGVPQCATANLSVGGGWLRPDQPGWGSYFLNFPGNLEAEAIYIYDADGLPRWVIGEGTYATALQKNLFQISGFCPTCPVVPTTRTLAGTASRTLLSSTEGTFESNISFADGLPGTWVQNRVPWAKLTPELLCQ